MSNNDKPHPDQIIPSFKFYSILVILTDIIFTTLEIQMLGKGLKYCPHVNKNKNIELLVVEVERILNHLEKKIKINTMLPITFVNKTYPNKTIYESKILKQVMKK